MRPWDFVRLCPSRPNTNVQCAPLPQVAEDSYMAPEQTPLALDRNAIVDVSDKEDVDADSGENC